MDDRSYSSLSRHGLASSNSLLDGVPFKIGPNFKPPVKVVAGLELCRRTVSTSVLNVEYTFDTEEGVLAWAQAREEALKKASLEQAEQLAEEQRKQEAETAADEDVNGESNIKNDSNEFNDINQNGGNIYDVPRSTASSMQNHVSHKQKPYLLPKPAGGISKPMSEPGSILKPTPIHSAANYVAVKKAETNTDNRLADTNSTFDVSMFESESDPFDNLELQTLNDMEELKILLDSSTKASSSIISTQTDAVHLQSSLDTNQGAALPEESASEIIYDIATAVKENTWETFSDDSPKDNTNIEADCEISNQREILASPNDCCSSVDETSEQVMEDGEYVEITNNYKKQTIKFHNHSVSEISNVTNSEDLTEKNGLGANFGGKLPSSLANSNLYNSVLQPFMKAESTTSDSNNASTNPFSQTSVHGSNPFLPQATQDVKNPFHPNTSDQWSLFNQTTESDGGNDDLPDAQSNSPTPVSKSSLLPPPPVAYRRKRQPVPTSRMWSSVGPSLAASLDESSSTSDHAPYLPYSRHSLSSSDLHSSSSCSDLGEVNCKSAVLKKPPMSQSSFQLWTRHRPLPPIPTPSPSIPHTTNAGIDSYKASLLPPSQQVGLTDPYYSLSQEAQAFTNSLTSMGFLRARVARAVAKFGQDEKEVLDHLLAVDVLVEKTFAPVLVESALNTFRNDVEKAEKYLQMLTQFEELGFSRDRIQEALIASSMDYDKVLDILTT